MSVPIFRAHKAFFNNASLAAQRLALRQELSSCAKSCLESQRTFIHDMPDFPGLFWRMAALQCRKIPGADATAADEHPALAPRCFGVEGFRAATPGRDATVNGAMLEIYGYSYSSQICLEVQLQLCPCYEAP